MFIQVIEQLHSSLVRNRSRYQDEFLHLVQRVEWLDFPGDHYNKYFKNWQGTIHNDPLRLNFLEENIKKEETCAKYAGSAKFNGIPRERKAKIPSKSYKDQCRENMIRNGILDVFSLPSPLNKHMKWDLLLHQFIFPLEYLKCHV